MGKACIHHDIVETPNDGKKKLIGRCTKCGRKKKYEAGYDGYAFNPIYREWDSRYFSERKPRL